eukprot:25204-Chlamydomonas_euryale.AAC.1
MESVAAGGCPGITAADAVQVAGAVAVFMTGGPQCPLLMGRPDAAAAAAPTDDASRLPHPCSSAPDNVAGFAGMGFRDPTLATAVLSGAHNIGRSRTTAGQALCSRGTVRAGRADLSLGCVRAVAEPLHVECAQSIHPVPLTAFAPPHHNHATTCTHT